MPLLPKALQDLIENLSMLPGVGPRTAERYAYFLLKNGPQRSHELSELIGQIDTKVKYCPVTFALIDSGEEVSSLYSDPSRDKKTIAVVAEPFDIIALEKTASYKGTYHVLGGLVSPIDGVNPEDLNIDQLVKRVIDDEVNEIILAISAGVEGETTSLIVQKYIDDSDINVKVTRLARGLPVGVDIEYADQITLSRALEGRTTL